jgi:hypothetical protein
MTKDEFKNMLDSLAADWAQRKNDKAAGFFASDIKYGDPTRYQFTRRADLLALFKNDEGYDQRTIWKLRNHQFTGSPMGKAQYRRGV